MRKTYISVFVIAATCAVFASCAGQVSEAELLQQASQSYELIFNTQGEAESTEDIRLQKCTTQGRKYAKNGRSFDTPQKDCANYPKDFCKGVCKNTHQKQRCFANSVQETTISGVIARYMFYTVDLGKDSVNRSEVI